MLNTRIKVKLCGLTRAEHAAEAVELGVDAIGMILHADSPRLISAQQAQLIRAEVPAFVTLVGVFVNCTVEKINHLAGQIGLDLIQLHGDESNAFAERLERPFIKAIRARSKSQVEHDIDKYPAARALLLDTYSADAHGGTGQQMDLSLWPHASQQKLVLAGGLNAQNIQHACQSVTPFAVDLNSGVESSPGVKDRALLKAALTELGR
ncbi:MAG: phosphoribosylanthranilate isomerase [Arenicella sp.]|nr:phosphoribosylanthranilate isomerase [Arenicella sp.]